MSFWVYAAGQFHRLPHLKKSDSQCKGTETDTASSVRRRSPEYENLIWFIFDNETEKIRDVFLILLKIWLFDVCLIVLIFTQVAFPCGFLPWCDSPISISQRESQPSRIFPRESIIFSPLSRQLRPPVALSWGNYCTARSRTIFGKYLGIFRLCEYLFSIVNCHVSPSPQHSASAILLRWYLSKLSVDK